MNTYVQKPYLPLLQLTLVAPPATLVTALLFLLMHSLIVTHVDPEEVAVHRIANIIVPDTKLKPLDTIKPPEPPVEVSKPPERLVAEVDLVPDSDVVGVPYNRVIPKLKSKIRFGDGGGIVAYLRPEPVYPARQLSRGIEGHVDLAFDITSAGSTTNIRVIDAEPKGAFERAAIKALKKWKYKVPIVDDQPQGQVDMMTRMTFRVDD